MIKSKLNWGIVGTGNIANEFAQSFNVKNSDLIAVASRSENKAKVFSENHQINKSYGKYEELLNDHEIDVLYIATPHNTHYDYIKKALKAGKHVVCEKSITTNAKQLKEVIKLAEEKQRYIFEAMTIHYMPLYEEIQKFILSTQLGPLKMIQVNFGSYKPIDQSKYFFNKDLAGGALFDIGVYALNFVRYFLSSMPTDVKTLGYINTSEVDESSAIVLKNSENELASISLTFRAKLPKEGIVAFEKGYFKITNYPRADRAVFISESGEITEFQNGDTNKALSYEIERISWIILNKKEQKFLGKTLDTMKIMDEIRSQWGLFYPFEKHNSKG